MSPDLPRYIKDRDEIERLRAVAAELEDQVCNAIAEKLVLREINAELLAALDWLVAKEAIAKAKEQP